MGSRRVSRKRLYEVEKAGQAIDLEAAAGMENTIISATQHRQGQEIITEIALDLNPSSVNLAAPGTAEYAIAEASKAAYITQLTEAKYGIITEVRAVVVENITDAGGGNDYDLHWNEVSKNQNQQVDTGTHASILTAINAKGEDTSGLIDDSSLTDRYLYLVTGSGSSSGNITGGKLLIYIHGFVAPADL